MGTPFSAISLSSSQTVTVTAHNRLNFATEPFTINLRFKGIYATTIATGPGWSIVGGTNVTATVNGTSISSSAITPSPPNIIDGAWHDIELVYDPDRIWLYIDGRVATPVSAPPASHANAAVKIFGGGPGVNADGNNDSAFRNNIAEFRISSVARHTNIAASPELAFTPPNWQFEDDGNTRLLWHFNEGKGSTIFDSSTDALDITDSGTRQNGTIAGGIGFWSYGPLLANPARIIHEALWYGLDTFSLFTTYANATELRRHRARQTDESTRRILTGGLTPPDMPGIWLFPESVSGVPPETNAYNEATIPMTIVGGIYKASAFSAPDLWWVTMRAIHALETTDAGSFLHYRVNNWRINRTGFFTTTDERGNLISRFVSEMLFTVRCDIRTSGTP